MRQQSDSTKKKPGLRIVMLGQKMVPSREGGVEVAVTELSTGMVKRGYAVTCLNRRGHKPQGAQQAMISGNEYQGVRLKTVFTINRKGFAAATSSFFGAIKAAFGPYDIVHFHSEGPCMFMWIPKLMGKSCVATIHGLDWKRDKWGPLGKAYIHNGEKTAAKYADQLIVVSNSAKTYFQEKYHRDPVWIPNGVQKPIIRKPDMITRLYGLEKDGYILFLGRLVPEKGLRVLIEAFKEVKTDKKLVIAGAQSDTWAFVNQMKQLAQDDKRILFTDFVDGQLLEELYSNSYLYVLPSSVEGMPISLLEAMSYGNCVCVSDIEENKETVDAYGTYFRSGDKEDLKRQLQMLVDHPQQRDLARKGAAEYVLKTYTWDNAVEQTLKVYQKAKR